MEVTTQDAMLRAKVLLKRAAQNGGKPFRIFIGFRANGANKLLLMAQESRSDITRSLPQAELLIDAKANTIETLAASIAKHWTALQEQFASLPAAPTSKPRPAHAWRGRGALRLRRRQ